MNADRAVGVDLLGLLGFLRFVHPARWVLAVGKVEGTHLLDCDANPVLGHPWHHVSRPAPAMPR